MAVFLKILSIIGISILCLLALVIFLLLLVLFVPVRYKAAGSFKENTLKAKAKVSWLLHIVSFSYVYGEEEPVSIRVFGIKIKKKKAEEESFKEENSEKGRKEDFEPVVKENISDVSASKAASFDEITPEKPAESTDSYDKDQSFESPYEDDYKEEKHKKEKKVSTKDNICDKIKKYIEIIKSDKFQKTYSYARIKIKKLLKHILPRRWDINAVLGFDDPSVTGNILVYSSVLYPFIAKHIHVYGDFNNQIIDVDGKAKGRITVLKAAIIGLQLYFNKDIKKVLKMFEEV